MSGRDIENRLEVGDLFAIDLTHDRFRHLDREWLVAAIVVKTGVSTAIEEWCQISKAIRDSPISSFLVFLEGVSPLFGELDTTGKAFSVHRIFDIELLNCTSVTRVGKRSLTKRETRLAGLISKSLALSRFADGPISQSVKKNVTLGFPHFNLETLASEFGTPIFDHHYDCDFEFTSHCLFCGLKHSDTLAKCHTCGKIRLGFDLIAEFIMDSCHPISEDTELSPNTLFSQTITEPKATDVQGPDGKWYDPFNFIELYMNQNELI